MALAGGHATHDPRRASPPVLSFLPAVDGHSSRPIHNRRVDEGYFDGGHQFDWFKRMALSSATGLEYLYDEVDCDDESRRWQIRHTCDAGNPARPWPAGPWFNASGPRAAATAGIKTRPAITPGRSSAQTLYLCCRCAKPLTAGPAADDRPLGVTFKNRREIHMGRLPPPRTLPWPMTTFAFDHSLWKDKVWPAIRRPVSHSSIRSKSIQ